MTKKEEFKEFVKTKPELVSYVETGKMTWQQFYELYDLYGSDRGIWDKYSGANINANSLDKIANMFKNVDVDSIQKHINSAQKALGLIEDLAVKKEATPIMPKGPTTPRPINKFFGD
jgi:hypothetical protein